MDVEIAAIPLAKLQSKAIVICGASHIGKTHFALAHFDYPLLVSEMDDLKNKSLRTDGIVFDQMRFNVRGGLDFDADSIIIR